MSLATAIASAAWLIGTQEYTGMTATTTPNAQAAASDPASAAAAQTTPPASASLSDTATAAAKANATTGVNGTAAANTATTATSAANVATAATANEAQAATQRSSATSAPSTPAAPSAAGQRAFIDPVTGQLRQPEHDELAAVAAEAAASAPARRSAAARTATASAATEFYGPDGSVGAVVPEDLHTFTVATRGPDGRIVIEHAQGSKDAAKVMKANSAKKPQAAVSRAQQKEDRNDR